MATNNLKNFTVQNNVYKGKVLPYVTNYNSLAELIWIKMKSNEDKIAQLDAYTEEEVTYTELQDKVVRCALWLQKQGIKPGDIVSVCTHNHVNSIVPCLAAIYVNAIFNPWDESMDLQNALHVVQLITPKVIFCSEKPLNVILNAMKESNCNPTVVVFGDHPYAISFSNILSAYSDTEVANFQFVELDDIKKTGCIMHSSGTTGMPKAVEMSNYSVIYLIDDINTDLTNEVSIWFSSLYWISGIMMNLKFFVQGAKVIIYPKFDEKMTCKLIEKYKITLMLLNASMFIRFLNAGYIRKYSLPSLKIILCSGGIIKPRVQEEMKCILPHVMIMQTFAMTEICGFGTLQLPNHKAGSCGTVVENVEMKIVDQENGNVLGPNSPGELWIKTATIMNGYYKNPGEIEGVLITHPAVMEAAVVGMPHPDDNEHPVAFVTKVLSMLSSCHHCRLWPGIVWAYFRRDFLPLSRVKISIFVGCDVTTVSEFQIKDTLFPELDLHGSPHVFDGISD